MNSTDLPTSECSTETAYKQYTYDIMVAKQKYKVALDQAQASYNEHYWAFETIREARSRNIPKPKPRCSEVELKTILKSFEQLKHRLLTLAGSIPKSLGAQESDKISRKIEETVCSVSFDTSSALQDLSSTDWSAYHKQVEKLIKACPEARKISKAFENAKRVFAKARKRAELDLRQAEMQAEKALKAAITRELNIIKQQAKAAVQSR